MPGFLKKDLTDITQKDRTNFESTILAIYETYIRTICFNLLTTDF